MYLATFALLKESTADEPGHWHACVREGAALAFDTLSKQEVPAVAEVSPVSNEGTSRDVLMRQQQQQQQQQISAED